MAEGLAIVDGQPEGGRRDCGTESRLILVARVAELAYAPDLGSGPARVEGSSPSSRSDEALGIRHSALVIRSLGVESLHSHSRIDATLGVWTLTTAELEKLKADYHVWVTLPIQWGDQDAFGHVNNTIYLRWFESARIEYGNRAGLSQTGQSVGPILAAISCNYRRQLTYPDTIHVGARITRIGNSSLKMEHRLISDRLGAVAADGDSTLVAFDYAAQRPVSVPAPIRASIEQLEGKSLAAQS